MKVAFGPGQMFQIPSGANPTVIPYGKVCQSIEINSQFSNKELHGQYQVAQIIARGQLKISGKVVTGDINGRALTDFFNGTTATGLVSVANNELGTVPASSTYIITVANSSTFGIDLGVVYGTTGLPLVRVASSPAAGQYSVSAGVYTFAAADASTVMYLSYTFLPVTGGKVISIANQLQGASDQFKAVVSMPYAADGSQVNWTLNSCISKGLKYATKQQDFVMPELDFDVFVDSANNIGTISIGEVD